MKLNRQIADKPSSVCRNSFEMSMFFDPQFLKNTAYPRRGLLIDF